MLFGFDKILRRLMKTTDERGRITSDRLRLSVRNTVRSMVERNARILDAGGADGLLFDPSATPNHRDVTILDFDKEILLTGIKAYGGQGRFILGDLTDMPFKSGSFDYTVCVSTFINFPGKDSVLRGIKELSRVTAPGGKTIIEFRNAANPLMSFLYRHARKHDKSLEDLPVHAYSPDEFRMMIEEAGLRVTDIRSVGPENRLLAIGYIFEAEHCTTRE